MSIVNKNCGICGILMESVHHAKLYCDSCKKTTLKNNQENHKINNPPKHKYSNEEYINNFYKYTDELYKLTIKGFNSVSNLKAQSYRN